MGIQESDKEGSQRSTEVERHDFAHDETLLEISRNTQCRECNASCILKKALLDYDTKAYCIVPNERLHAVLYNHPVMNNDILLALATNTLTKSFNKARTLKDRKIVFDMITGLKNYFFPEVQKTANLNMNVNAAKEIVEAVFKNR